MRSLRLGFHRGLAETRAFWRNGSAVGVSIVLPIALVLLFGSLFKGNVKGTDIPLKFVVATGMIASVVVQSGFANLAAVVAAEREDGTLARLRGMPFPLGAYIVGKTILLLSICVLQIILVLLAGILVLHLHVPSDPTAWLTFAWVLALGLLASSMLGLIIGSMIPTARLAPALTNVPFVLLQFISGVFYTFTALPRGLQVVGDVFPLKWMAQGMHSVFLPHSMLGAEPHHSWQHGTTALVLGAWVLGGIVLAPVCFRWRRGVRHRLRAPAASSGELPT